MYEYQPDYPAPRVPDLKPARRNRWPRRIVITALLLSVVLLAAVFGVRYMYNEGLRPVSGDSTTRVVTIESGSSVGEIAAELKEQGLIRQPWAFERYVSAFRLGDKLQAGTYKLAPSQSVRDIVDTMVRGRVAVDLFTIVPGQRIDQVRDAFIKARFDASSVDAALDASRYADSPALSDKPSGASLEGFLYPESYQRDASTNPETVVRAALNEMEARLTPQLRASLASQGLSVYQAVTLASIVEQEVSHPEDRAQAAQVFLKRLRSDIALASDTTAPYGAIIAGQKPSLTFASPYNTYTNKGLPPGPIGSVSESSLKAVADPAPTDWLYFVAGDDGQTHFSKTLAEHESLTKQYCHRLCN